MKPTFPKSFSMMLRKQTPLHPIAIILASIILLFCGCDHTLPQDNSFGIYLSADTDTVLAQPAVDEIVIDAQYYSADDIRQLKSRGSKVYSYLNIGSLEEFRDYYDRFADRTTGSYENWSDERWIDVTDTDWQRFVSGTLADELIAKEIDGFFVDNTDVYDQSPTRETFDGILAILTGLAAKGLPVILNGGDHFVRRLLNGTAIPPFDGVCQESVVTTVTDYDNDEFGLQDEEATAYFYDYLTLCHQAGLRCYAVEYANTPESNRAVTDFYRSRPWIHWYLASSLSLKASQ